MNDTHFPNGAKIDVRKRGFNDAHCYVSFPDNLPVDNTVPTILTLSSPHPSLAPFESLHRLPSQHGSFKASKKPRSQDKLEGQQERGQQEHQAPEICLAPHALTLSVGGGGLQIVRTFRTLLRMLLHLLLTHLLHAMRTRHMPSPLHPRPRQHPPLPRLQMRELIDIDARPSGGRDPAPVRDVGYRASVADQVAGRRGREVFVQHAVQAPGFVLVARDAVVDSLGCVAEEMVRLALHGSDARVQEEEPVVDFVGLARAGWVADFVVDAVVLLDEVLHDGAGFEEADRLAVREGVGEGGNAAVGVDGEEEGLFLGVLGYVDFVGFVSDASEGEGVSVGVRMQTVCDKGQRA